MAIYFEYCSNDSHYQRFGCLLKKAILLGQPPNKFSVMAVTNAKSLSFQGILPNEKGFQDYSAMEFLDAVFAGVGFVVRTVTRAAKNATQSFIRETVEEWVGSVITDLQQGKNSSAKVRDDLEVVDAEVTDLEQKFRYDRYTSRSDQERLKELEQTRASTFREYQKTKTEEIAVEQASSPDEYETAILNNDKAHVLQYQMGQVVLEKKCPTCKRPMFLQHRKQPRGGTLFQLSDFFWSCVGFYDKKPTSCQGGQGFFTEDLGLLHKAGIPELEISNADLNLIFSQKPVEQVVVRRVRDHLKEKDDDVLCKVHHIPMVLREKQEHMDVATDMFHLGCPHPKCTQTVKLKSAAQLAAFLRRKEGSGIL